MRLSLLFLILLVLTACSEIQDKAAADKELLLNINGVEQFVRVIGKGKPLLIIHGGPLLDHTYLLPFLKPLSDSNTLIFYDQRLSGRSAGEMDSLSVRLEVFVDDIDKIRDSLGYDKINILGHSWGGLLAMKYAVTYPQNLDRLILSNTIPPTTSLWQQENIALAHATSPDDSSAIAEIAQSESFKNREVRAIEKMMEVSLRQQFYDRKKGESLQIHFPADYMNRSRQFGYLMPDLMNYDLLEELHQLDIPTLIIYGDAEPAAEISGRILADTIVNNKFLVIKESGHFPFIEQQEEFLDSVRKFIK